MTCLIRYCIFFFFVLRLFFYVLIIFPKKDTAYKYDLLQRQISRFLNLVTIKFDIQGNSKQLDPQGYLFVANHISYFDPVVLFYTGEYRFIASEELKKWPVIGKIIQQFNLIFLNRNQAEKEIKINHIVNALNKKENIMLFAEGTTSEPNQISPFKSTYFQSALIAKTKIAPIVIRYLLANGQVNPAFNFSDDRGFFRILTDVFKTPESIVKIVFLEPFTANDYIDKYQLSEHTHQKMVEVFNQMASATAK